MSQQDNKPETPFERDYREAAEAFESYMSDLPFRRTKSWTKKGRPSRVLSAVFNFFAPPDPVFALPKKLPGEDRNDKDTHQTYELLIWLHLLGIRQSARKLADGKTTVRDIFDSITDRKNELTATAGPGKGETVAGLEKFAVRSPEAGNDGRIAFYDDVLALINAAQELENREQAAYAADTSGTYASEEDMSRTSYLNWLKTVVTEARDTGAKLEDIKPRPLNPTTEWKMKQYTRDAKQQPGKQPRP